MTAQDFCYWLSGYVELVGAGSLAGGLSPDQLDTLRRHLALVFYNATAVPGPAVNPLPAPRPIFDPLKGPSWTVQDCPFVRASC